MYYIQENNGIPNTTLKYTPVQITEDLGTAFSVANFPTAAKTVMDEELNNYTAFTRSITMSTIPIYSLDVNKKIRIATDETKGQFVIDRLTIPLNYNGTMSMTLSEITDSLY
jgi:hypothetical protein